MNTIESYKKFMDRVGRKPTRESNAELCWVKYLGECAQEAKDRGETHPLMDIYINNGTLARQQLIEDNLAMVVREFPKACRKTSNWDCTAQRLALALIHHIDKFDPTKGFALSTYCLTSLIHYSNRLDMMEEHTVYKPVHIMKEMAQVANACRERDWDLFETQFTRNMLEILAGDIIKQYPSSTFARGKMDRANRVRDLLGLLTEHHIDGNSSSYDEDGWNEGEDLFSRLPSNVHEFDIRDFEAQRDTNRLLQTLKPDQALALSLRYLHDLTYKEMSESVGTTRQNQEQKIKGALKKLRRVVDQSTLSEATKLQRRRAEEQMAELMKLNGV